VKTTASDSENPLVVEKLSLCIDHSLSWQATFADLSFVLFDGHSGRRGAVHASRSTDRVPPKNSTARARAERQICRGSIRA
jgi:hypothetical protein